MENDLVPPQIVLAIVVAKVFLAGTTPALAQESNSLQGFEACKVITTDQARLDCLKKLLPKPIDGHATG